ncbi:MAG: iron-containing alcohol dehydrogenase [Candidatus Binatia bacterium]|nr:iron-containing alcohol dehydrogenase [Candidatus Binatia bacterium]MDG2010815.1 iron-containing alcohol dehydrogenase [Candidatus Binatia bacterium]
MPNFLSNADWSFPVPIRYGPGRLSEIGVACKEHRLANPLIVTDRGSRDLPFIELVSRACHSAGVQSSVFSDVSPNPTDRNIALGKAAFNKGRHDGIIAIGGGSGMDAGKAISLVSRSNTDLWAFDYDQSEAPDLSFEAFAPLVCVPTTAGTGAETESTAMLTDTAVGTKRCVWHRHQKPLLAILDPELTVKLPPDLTAWTGCDALVHAIEALSVPDLNPLCDGLALESIRLITGSLEKAVAHGDDLEARGAMLVGSCLAGISFLKGLGLVHAMSHMVGAVCDTHHGLTNAVLLPPVLLFNRAALEEKAPLISDAMGLGTEDFDSMYAGIVGLLDELKIPRGLADLQVPEEALDAIAEKAITDSARATNPVPSTVRDIRALLGRSFVNAR